jgi:hypothetical protein
MDPERDSLRQTYQLTRLGFGILSASLLLACLTAIVYLVGLFGGRSICTWITNMWWWRWIGTPIVWGSLIGTYLLWGRWTDTGWQRRVGLLILMGMVDAVLWGLEHGDESWLGVGDVGHRWLRDCLGQALGWAEFALLASLAGDVIAHLGVEAAREASKSTRALAATGAVIWMLLFCQRTDWDRGWPLEGPRRDSIETVLLDLGSTMVWTITLIQVTALTIAATRESSRALTEMAIEDRGDDLFRSRSEINAGLLPRQYDGAPSDGRDSSDNPDK